MSVREASLERKQENWHPRSTKSWPRANSKRWAWAFLRSPASGHVVGVLSARCITFLRWIHERGTSFGSEA